MDGHVKTRRDWHSGCTPVDDAGYIIPADSSPRRGEIHLVLISSAGEFELINKSPICNRNNQSEEESL